jgi:FkbM family methyltransferase
MTDHGHGPSFRRAFYRVVSIPIVGYALLLSWQKGWLPLPRRSTCVQLRDGRVLRFELADRTQRTMYLGLFEPGETRLIRELLAAGDTFIDVGAHIGWFSTIAARRVGGTGQVIAVEPYHANAVMLRENAERNDCLNVSVAEMALGSEPGMLSLGQAGDSGSVTALEYAKAGRAPVRMAPLDDIAPGGGTVALLKIDVEGWEAHVLRGAGKTLLRTRAVLIEVNREALRNARSSPDELFRLLRESGFDSFQPVARRGIRRLHRDPVENILAVRREVPPAGPGGVSAASMPRR